MELRRPSVIVALLTPFDEDGRFDEPALSAHVDQLVDAGVDALMPCGTTGEAALLSDEEVAEVVRPTSDARAPHRRSSWRGAPSPTAPRPSQP
jgi:dihydrodipicolinate synthase/N-acetylneuraminate lyase